MHALNQSKVFSLLTLFHNQTLLDNSLLTKSGGLLKLEAVFGSLEKMKGLYTLSDQEIKLQWGLQETLGELHLVDVTFLISSQVTNYICTRSDNYMLWPTTVPWQMLTQHTAVC